MLIKLFRESFSTYFCKSWVSWPVFHCWLLSLRNEKALQTLQCKLVEFIWSIVQKLLTNPCLNLMCTSLWWLWWTNKITISTSWSHWAMIVVKGLTVKSGSSMNRDRWPTSTEWWNLTTATASLPQHQPPVPPGSVPLHIVGLWPTKNLDLLNMQLCASAPFLSFSGLFARSIWCNQSLPTLLSTTNGVHPVWCDFHNAWKVKLQQSHKQL